MKTDVITYKELAVAYFPKSTVESARRQLRRWINYNTMLQQALSEAGYKKGQKTLTPRQVREIYNYLGEPGE